MNSKESAIMLANEKAVIIVADYNNDGCKQYVVRRVIGHNSLRQGKATFYGVELDSPLSDGSTEIDSRFVLAYSVPNKLELSKFNSDILMERKRKLFDDDILNSSAFNTFATLVLTEF